jgi:hypothetical protein
MCPQSLQNRVSITKMPPKGARSAKRKAPAKGTPGAAAPQGKILEYFAGSASAPGSKRRRGEQVKEGARAKEIEDCKDALPPANTADEPVVIEDSRDGAASPEQLAGPSSAPDKEKPLSFTVFPAGGDSGAAAGASGRSAAQGKTGVLGNFGALVTHPREGAAGKVDLQRGWWGRSYSLAYRNLFSDRRPAGVGCQGASWGRRTDLSLTGFRCAVLGGGKAAHVLTIPTAGPYRTPAVDARHWRNLRFMLNALSQQGAGEQSAQEPGPFDPAVRRVFERIVALPAPAQELFATLRHAAYGACGGLPASACRWFICQEKWAQDAACALCDAGLARRLRSVSDVDCPVSLLPLLSDLQLRQLVDSRLGGNSKMCRDRDSLVAAILEVALRMPTAGQQCIKFHRASARAPAAGECAGSPRKKEKKARCSPSKSSVQTVLHTGCPQATLPRAVLEMLAAGPLTRETGGKRKSGQGHGVQKCVQNSKNTPMERVVCIRLTDEAEAACHRLQMVFFVVAGFSPDEAAALHLCDLERLAQGLGWKKSSQKSSQSLSGAATADVSEDEYDAPAGAGCSSPADDTAHVTGAGADQGGGGGGGWDSVAWIEGTSAASLSHGAATPALVGLACAWPGWSLTQLPTRQEARELEEAVACSDDLEHAVRQGDHAAAYELVAKAVASLILQERDEFVDEGSEDGGETAKDRQAGTEPTTDANGQKSKKEARCFDIPCFWSRVVVCGIGLLERDKQYRKAVEYIDLLLTKSVLRLRPCSRGQLLLRKTMDLQHVGASDAALRVCEQACQDHLVIGEYRVAFETRCARLAVPPLRWRKPVFPPRSAPVTRTIVADHPSVECGAMEWYLTEAGWQKL